MKTLLFEKIDTKEEDIINQNNEIFTFDETKNYYAEQNDSDLPIPDDDMLLIVYTDLSDTFKAIDDDIIKWCNEYSLLMDADRYLSQEEKDESNRDIYLAIKTKDDIILSEIKQILNEGAADDKDLISLREKFYSLIH